MPHKVVLLSENARKCCLSIYAIFHWKFLQIQTRIYRGLESTPK